MSRTTGRVLKFNADRNFGFVEIEGLTEIFFSGHSVAPYGTIASPGDIIEFDIEPDRKRAGSTRAVRVNVVRRRDEPLPVVPRAPLAPRAPRGLTTRPRGGYVRAWRSWDRGREKVTILPGEMDT